MAKEDEWWLVTHQVLAERIKPKEEGFSWLGAILGVALGLGIIWVLCTGLNYLAADTQAPGTHGSSICACGSSR
jgi:hypothetical protein